jgi:regulator of replication initiation timing
MNDKDKEAFDEWRNSTSARLDIHDAWQAACEYKDEELNEWKEAARSEAEEVNRLQVENKKLREALQQIAYHVGKFPIHESYCELSHIAREALKEVEKK